MDWVAELSGKFLEGWPKGMRLIIRKERLYPRAQLRIRDAAGMRITCFATNTPDRPIAELELRHWLRARRGPNPGPGNPAPTEVDSRASGLAHHQIRKA